MTLAVQGLTPSVHREFLGGFGVSARVVKRRKRNGAPACLTGFCSKRCFFLARTKNQKSMENWCVGIWVETEWAGWWINGISDNNSHTQKKKKKKKKKKRGGEKEHNKKRGFWGASSPFIGKFFFPSLRFWTASVSEIFRWKQNLSINRGEREKLIDEKKRGPFFSDGEEKKGHFYFY